MSDTAHIKVTIPQRQRCGWLLGTVMTLALLFSQTVAAQHDHLDLEPAADCLVCLQLDQVPVLPQVADAPAAGSALRAADAQPSATRVARLAVTGYVSRAPPTV